MLSSGSPAAPSETVPWMKGKHAPGVRASIAAHDPAVPTAAAAPSATPRATIDPDVEDDRT